MHPAYGHTGMLKTYTSLLLYLPTQNVTLALLVNRTHVDLGGMLAAKPGGRTRRCSSWSASSRRPQPLRHPLPRLGVDRTGCRG